MRAMIQSLGKVSLSKLVLAFIFFMLGRLSINPQLFSSPLQSVADSFTSSRGAVPKSSASSFRHDHIYQPIYNGAKAYQSLYDCNNECNSFQNCFMGKCYCLPSRAGPTCEERLVHHKVNEQLCPTYSSYQDVITYHSVPC